MLNLQCFCWINKIFFVTFVKIWTDMASELQDTLSRILSKSKILLEKYRCLETEKSELEARLDEAEKEILELKAENQKLRQSKEYLELARNIAPSPEKVVEGRAFLSKIVRDIDKCISQLNV